MALMRARRAEFAATAGLPAGLATGFGDGGVEAPSGEQAAKRVTPSTAPAIALCTDIPCSLAMRA
jgi:hypothetical protein